MMMKSKLCAALCALLLVINLGSAEHVSGGGETTPKAPASGPVSVSSPGTVTHAVPEPSPSGPDANSSTRVDSSLSGNITTEGKNVSVTTEAMTGTDIVAPTEAAGPAKNKTDQTPPQPAITASWTHAPTSPTPLPSTTTTTTTTTTSATPTTTADASTTSAPPTNTSHPAGIPLPDSTAPSNASSTPVSTPEPPKSETNTSTTTITTTQSTSSTTPRLQLNITTVAQPKSTVLPLSNTSAQAKPRADPSQPSSKEVANNPPTIAHNPPTLDPLLAGLVSAFIITAVIITLLLFLKLRRRDNRPAFHRLQDLPMDDMMEDTPLSMYSY